MIADILAEIDAEIARLQQARSLLSTLTGTGEPPKRTRTSGKVRSQQSSTGEEAEADDESRGT